MVELFSKIFSMVAPSDNQRGEAWRRMLLQTIRSAETLHHAGAVEDARMHHLSVDGGTCEKCGTAWREVAVNNKFAHGRYFKPACKCYVWWGADKRGYRAICDKCRTGVRMDRWRRVLNAAEVREIKAAPKYERVVCGKCGGKREEVPDELR